MKPQRRQPKPKPWGPRGYAKLRSYHDIADPARGLRTDGDGVACPQGETDARSDCKHQSALRTRTGTKDPRLPAGGWESVAATDTARSQHSHSHSTVAAQHGRSHSHRHSTVAAQHGRSHRHRHSTVAAQPQLQYYRSTAAATARSLHSRNHSPSRSRWMGVVEAPP